MITLWSLANDSENDGVIIFGPNCLRLRQLQLKGGREGGNDNVQFKIDDIFIELNLALSM